jgi:hypothetical protein
MALEIADETLRVLNLVKDRCGQLRQDGYGDKEGSPILIFTIAMLRLIASDEEPPSPQTLADIRVDARAALRGGPE